MFQQRFSQLLFLVSICLLASPGFDASSLRAQEVNILGKWESVARSSGGIGNTLEFHSDTTVSLTPGAMVDFTYHLDGTRLVMSLTDPGTGQVSDNTVDVYFGSDSMIQRDPISGQETRFVQLKAVKADTLPIVGTWSFKHHTGATAFQIFTADGDMHLRVQFRTDDGTYVLSGDSLTINIKGQDPWQVGYALGENMLTLSSADGTQVQYKRVPW